MSRNHNFSCAIVAAACLSVLSTVAVAPAAAQGTADERSACEGDAFKFCASDIPFVSRIEACLVANESQLTPACRAEFSPAKKTKLRPEHFKR